MGLLLLRPSILPVSVLPPTQYYYYGANDGIGSLSGQWIDVTDGNLYWNVVEGMWQSSYPAQFFPSQVGSTQYNITLNAQSWWTTGMRFTAVRLTTYDYTGNPTPSGSYFALLDPGWSSIMTVNDGIPLNDTAVTTFTITNQTADLSRFTIERYGSMSSVGNFSIFKIEFLVA